jgi:hypothetical protein
MYKSLVFHEEDFNNWQKGQLGGASPNAIEEINRMQKPTEYPAVVLYHWETDAYSRDWLSYEYVYQSDFVY